MELRLDGKRPWTAIVVTCQNKAARHAIQNELESRQKKGLVDRSTLVLAIEDPARDVGSGGATLNALYITAEHLGTRQGYTVVTADVLQDARIVIFHMGLDFPFDACGRAFATLPLTVAGNEDTNFLFTNFDMLLHTVSHQLAVDSPPGVWVCSTDMILSFPEQLDCQSLKNQDFCIVAIPATPDYARHHGSLRTNVSSFDKDGTVLDIIYKGKPDVLSRCKLPSGDIPISSGIMYLGCGLVDKLLSLTVVPPLDACTYIGLDNGAQPTKLSLLFDIALSMCIDIMEEAYVMGERSGFYGTSGRLPDDQVDIMQDTRHMLWNALNEKYRTKAILMEGGVQNYIDPMGMSDSAVTFHKCLLMASIYNWNSHQTIDDEEDEEDETKFWNWKPVIHSQITTKDVAYKTAVINSVIESGVMIPTNTTVSHCKIPANTHLGSGCYYSGLCHSDFTTEDPECLPDEMVFIAFRIKMPGEKGTSTSKRIITILGRCDDVLAPFWEASSTIWGDSWKFFFKRFEEMDKDDLWLPNLNAEETNLFNAKLFPISVDARTARDMLLNLRKVSNIDEDLVHSWKGAERLSLAEIISYMDMDAEFAWRREIFYGTGEQKVRDILLGEQQQGLSKLYLGAVVDGYHEEMLKILDDIASTCNSPGVAARTLANIAEVLGHMANGRGGMRSGPSHNQQWKGAFSLLEQGEIAKGVAALAFERSYWLNSPEYLIRAARHYDGAAQILIRQAVMTGKKFIELKDGEPAPIGTWVVAECPARVDLSGAWSDTPPITYEHGGAVVTVGVLIDGKKPIGAKVRRIPEHHIMLHAGNGPSATTITLEVYDDLADYNQPYSRGALLKAALYCTEVIEYDQNISLEKQLKNKYNGGFEMYLWSELPHGSGLGTSSILAGAVMGALWTAVGKKYENKDLIHAVVILEQMLTTGGGWQDQVGGLVGNIVLGTSKAGLPLLVEQRILNVSPTTAEAFVKQFVLVYTGKTRLARDLLQNVVRRWYARLPGIVQTEDGLVSNTLNCAKALEEDDLETVGKCLDNCQKQKLHMAPGSEPTIVMAMRDVLKPHILGMCMSGAGGGGFLYVLLKSGCTKQMLSDLILKVPGTESVTLHSIKIDTDGLKVQLKTDT